MVFRFELVKSFSVHVAVSSYKYDYLKVSVHLSTTILIAVEFTKKIFLKIGLLKMNSLSRVMYEVGVPYQEYVNIDSITLLQRF